MKDPLSNHHNRFILAALFIMPFCVSSVNGQADTAPNSSSAWALYTANKFADSADMFEAVLKKSSPSARLYYQAAIANYAANRRARARQLCTYVVKNFKSTQEAAHSTRLFPELATAASTADAAGGQAPKLLDENNLPPNFFDGMTPDVRQRLKTPQGKIALRAAIADYNKRMMAAASKVPPSGGPSEKVIVSKNNHLRTKTSPFPPEATLKRGDHPFSATQVARDGAKGIDQGANPNCWFEASMAALAELPRGQRLLASMITYGGNGIYIVRFPGDGEEYKIDEETLDRHGIRDTAQWASLISCAQVMKFPNNRGAEGATGDQSRLAVGLGCITGCKAQTMSPGSADPQELSSFIGGAISSKNPIVCGTWDDMHLGHLPPLVVSTHAYTIIGFDPASNMITIRNPHGRGSQEFDLADDPSHRQFEMKEDGVFKMHLSLFQKYFYQVCRSFI